MEETNVIDALMNDELESAIKQLRTLEPGSEEYKRAAESVSVLRGSLAEGNKRVNERVERRCKIVQTIAGVLGAVVPTILYGLCFTSGLEFERSGTVTSLVSRQNLSNVFRRR